MCAIDWIRTEASESVIRVFHLIPSFGPGGAERQLSLLAPALLQVGVEIHVAYLYGGPNLARLQGSGVDLHVLPASPNDSPALAWNIFKLIRRLEPDIVQTWIMQMDILGGCAALLQGVPFIVREPSSADAYALSWKVRLRQLVGRRAVRIVANSRGGLDYWRSHVPPDRLSLVRNIVVRPEQTEEEALSLDVAPSAAPRPLVLFAGRFSYEKNIPRLIEALILVAQQRPDAAIRMFGEGPARHAAERRIAEAGLEHQIEISGYTSKLPAWMACAAACVSVSLFEGHSNVIMEAAAAGCPLVLSDITAHRELFDEGSALLAPADSAPRIADAVIQTLKYPVEAGARAQRARAIALQFDLQTAAATYRSIYEAIAGTIG